MTPKTAPAASEEDGALSAQERTSLKERTSELKAQSRRAKAADKAAADLNDVLAKIAQMPQEDRALAQRVHDLVTTAAPHLAPKLYYGQPGYAREGKLMCFFRSGQMDKLRYSTFGFSVEADLDDASGLWPTSYALTTDATDEAFERIGELVVRASGQPQAERR